MQRPSSAPPRRPSPTPTRPSRPPVIVRSLVLNAVVNGCPVRCLIDSGATFNFIRRQVAVDAGLTLTRPDTRLRTVRFANGAVETVADAAVGVPVAVAHSSLEPTLSDFAVMTALGDQRYEAVLGMPWLTAAQARIDFARRAVAFGPNDLMLPAVPYVETLRGPELAASADEVAPLPPLDDVDLKRRAERIYKDYSFLFPPDLPPGLPPQRAVDHKIELYPDMKPPTQAPHKLSDRELTMLKELLDNLQHKQFITPSVSPYGAPVFFTKKNDGGRRLVVDYRRLNAQTVRNEAGLPSIDETFALVTGARVYSKLDLASGYHQLRVAPEDRHKTAFRTRYGHFQWNVLPFGLTAAPASFQQLMTELLAPYLDKFVACFLDDLLIFSATPEEHEQHLRLVLDRLSKERLFCKRSKCALFQRQVTFLGHLVDERGLDMEATKVSAIREWPRPKSLTELRSFLGLANYYRAFVRDYSRVALPLTDLLRTKTRSDGVAVGQKLQWTDEAQSAFDALKSAVSSAPMLLRPLPHLPFLLHTDASDFAVGAALSQRTEAGVRPIAFMSSKLTPAEVKYAAYEKEALALIKALAHFRPFIDGRPITVVTDHHALTYLLTQQKLTPRQARWTARLADYNVRITYQKGSLNVVADALSRRPDHADPVPRIVDRQSPEARQLDAKELNLRATVQLTGSQLRDDILQAQHDDELCQRLLRDPRSVDNRQLELHVRDGALYARDQLYVPDNSALKTRILREAHDAETAGHSGIARTFERVSRVYYWPNMQRQVADYIASCDVCQRSKASNQRPAGLLQPLPVPDRPWQSISIDLITALPRTRGTRYDAILVIVDRFTKMAHYVPTVTSVTGDQLVELLLRHVVRLHGLPASIVSDRDPRFTGAAWRDFWRLCRTTLRMSSAFHPQSDGQTERANRTLEEYLRAYTGYQQDEWDRLLPLAEFAHNDSKQTSTGFTPFFLLYGHHPHSPLMQRAANLDEVRAPVAEDRFLRIAEALEQAKLNLIQAQQRQKAQADKRRSDAQYAVGDQVLLTTRHLRMPGAKKLHPKFIGPFPVIERVGTAAYRLELPARYTFHPVQYVGHLRPFVQSDEFPERQQELRLPPVVDEEKGEQTADVFELERIVDKRQRRRKTEYLVKWRSYPDSDNEWLPVDRLAGAAELIQEYEQRQQASDALAADALTADAVPPHPLAAATTDDDSDAEATGDALQLERLFVSPDRVIEADRCIANTTKGTRCRRRTRRSGYCWSHLQMLQDLRIKESTLPGAGLGLFVDGRPIAKGAHVADYTGPVVDPRTPPWVDVGNDYLFELSKSKAIDGSNSKNVASYANDCRAADKRAGHCRGSNARFTYDARSSKARLVATRKLAANEEIFVPYGRIYWSGKARQAREQAQARHELAQLSLLQAEPDATRDEWQPAGGVCNGAVR